MEEEVNPETTQNPGSGESPDGIREKIVEVLKGVL